MKQLKVESCFSCPLYGRADNFACHKQITDINSIHPDCPLEDDTPKQTDDILTREWKGGYTACDAIWKDKIQKRIEECIENATDAPRPIREYMDEQICLLRSLLEDKP